MKIEIYKKENDENIYFKYESNEKVLNFDNLKDLTKLFLDKAIKAEEITYSFECTQDLTLYKNTIDDVIKSVIEDTELKDLYKEHKSDESN